MINQPNQNGLTGISKGIVLFGFCSLLYLTGINVFGQCANLIENPDFEEGNIGFTSNYEYQVPGANSIQNPQTYTIANDAGDVHDNFVGVDHTTGNGMFMIVNGVGEELDVWCQRIGNLQPNTDYVLSVWASTLSELPPATIQFAIDGQKIGDSFKCSEAVSKWVRYVVSWNSGNNTAVELCIKSFNSDAVADGNDFGLDDLSITCCNAEVNAGEDLQICRGSSAQLGASAATSYLWKPGESLDDPTKKNPTATPAETTTYTVFAKVNGCETTDEVTITVKYVEGKVSADTAICLGESVRLVASGGEAYSWTPIDWLSSPTNPTPTSTPEKTITYTVIIEKDNCADEKEVTVTIRDLNVDAGEDREICNNNEIQLEATGATEYLWSPQAWLSATEIANPVCKAKQTITYTVFAKDGLCEGMDTITVFVRKVATKFTADSVCLGMPTNFVNLSSGSDTTMLKWKWDFGDGINSEDKNPTHVFTSEGTHQVELTSSIGKCKVKNKVDVLVYPIPFADFDADTWIGTTDFPSFTFFDLSEGGITGIWEFNDGSPSEIYMPGENKEHTFGTSADGLGPYNFDVLLEVENEFGCKADTMHSVQIEPIWAFFVPNAFTPDNDGTNDVFKPVGDGVTEFDFRIFNKWGELVFSTQNFNEGWGGYNQKGKEQQEGVYSWIIRFKNNYGENKAYQGHVSLLR